MWRSFFLAIGFFICLIGLECLVIDTAIFSEWGEAASGDLNALATRIPLSITPPDWAPWVLLTSGAVVMIYSFTIPRRVRA